MKRRLAIAFAAIAFLATVGWHITGAASDHEPKRVALEKVRVMRIADGDSTSSASASANRDSNFALNELATILKGDDPESLRLELLACLLIMLIAPVAALLAILCIDHWTAQRNV